MDRASEQLYKFLLRHKFFNWEPFFGERVLDLPLTSWPISFFLIFYVIPDYVAAECVHWYFPFCCSGTSATEKMDTSPCLFGKSIDRWECLSLLCWYVGFSQMCSSKSIPCFANAWILIFWPPAQNVMSEHLLLWWLTSVVLFSAGPPVNPIEQGCMETVLVSWLVTFHCWSMLIFIILVFIVLIKICTTFFLQGCLTHQNTLR